MCWSVKAQGWLRRADTNLSSERDIISEPFLFIQNSGSLSPKRLILLANYQERVALPDSPPVSKKALIRQGFFFSGYNPEGQSSGLLLLDEPMRLASHLLRSRHGVYSFHLVLPASLRAVLGQTEIKRSLNAKSPVVARLLAYELSAKMLSIDNEPAFRCPFASTCGAYVRAAEAL